MSRVHPYLRKTGLEIGAIRLQIRGEYKHGKQETSKKWSFYCFADKFFPKRITSQDYSYMFFTIGPYDKTDLRKTKVVNGFKPVFPDLLNCELHEKIRNRRISFFLSPYFFIYSVEPLSKSENETQIYKCKILVHKKHSRKYQKRGLVYYAADGVPLAVESLSRMREECLRQANFILDGAISNE